MAKKLLPAIILIISVAIAVVLIKSRPDAEQNENLQQVLLVDVSTVLPSDSFITVRSQGTVEPRTRTTLISEVSGQVVSVSPGFVNGGFFRKGDLLLQLDDMNYQAAVTRNQAAVASAKSQLEQEKGQADVALREWERLSPERKAQVKAKDLYLRKPQLEEAQAKLASAQADLEQALNDLSKTKILAPYDGMISEKMTDIGQFVTTGANLAETFAVDYAEVRLPIPENKIPFLDLPASIRSITETSRNADGPEVILTNKVGDKEYSWVGRLIRTEGVLDTRTRVLFSVVQIEDPYGLNNSAEMSPPLRIGTYVNATIHGRDLNNVVVLPRYTLQANDIVWVADPENRLRARKVDVLTVNSDQVYITSGFKPGDQVVLTRLENPLNGTVVQTNALPAPSIR